MADLRSLREHPEWPAYQTMLAGLYELQCRSLLNAADYGDYRERLGGVKVFETLYHSLDLVVGKADQTDEHRRQSDDNQQQRDRQLRAGRYASRLWDTPNPD